MIMGKLTEYAKAILTFVLKLILMMLKKRGKTPIHMVKHTSRKNVSSADKSRTSDDSFFSMTSASKLSLSSGIGSSICSTGSSGSSSQEDGEFDFESPEVCSFRAEIERLRTENKVLRGKLSQKQVGSRNSHQSQPTEPTDLAERSLEHKRRGSSLCQAMSSTPLTTTSEDDIGDDMDDVVLEKLKLKHKLEKEENRRLQNYINDVMYLVLETRPNLLEK